MREVCIRPILIDFTILPCCSTHQFKNLPPQQKQTLHLSNHLAGLTVQIWSNFTASSRLYIRTEIIKFSALLFVAGLHIFYSVVSEQLATASGSDIIPKLVLMVFFFDFLSSWVPELKQTAAIKPPWINVVMSCSGNHSW